MALMNRDREKVDASQLEIKDTDMQLRLLVDSLKPVVAG